MGGREAAGPEAGSAASAAEKRGADAFAPTGQAGDRPDAGAADEALAAKAGGTRAVPAKLSPAGAARGAARGVTPGKILRFFLPLGLSASLVTLSHVIINGTLARSPQPELIIAGYTIAQSIFSFTERPAVLLRQTGSALVTDRTSFRALARLTAGLIALIILIGTSIAFTPAGPALIGFIFGAEGELAEAALSAYRVIVFVSVFSALRCLYHGVLIRKRNTKWLTLGMLLRLAVMYAASWLILRSGVAIGGHTGAFIFLIGMATEAAFGFVEGRSTVRGLPERDAASTVARVRDIFPFYRPLVLSSFLAVVVAPVINIMLGKTSDMSLAIASFAVAGSITQLTLSFFSYAHQIALQFYPHDPRTSLRVAAVLHTLPFMLLSVLAFTPVGPWALRHVLGAEGTLLNESLAVLRCLLPQAALFAWIDFCNGLMMLRNQTRVLIRTQTANILTVTVVLVAAVAAVPDWNGRLGALAQSAGSAAELLTLLLILRLYRKRQSFSSSRGGVAS